MIRQLDAIVLILTLIFPSLTAKQLMAGGYMIPHQTARGLGLSNAMTAGVTDPSAVYYNPAALAEVQGNNLQLGGTYVNLANSVRNDGRKAVNEHDDNFLGTLFANYHLPGEQFTFGIGLYSPFGLATTYQKDFTRFAAQRSELRTLYVTPALSWAPSKYLSVGAGFSFVHASGLFSRSLCLAPPGVPDPLTGAAGCTVRGGLLEGRVRLTDTANAFTYNVGLVIKPTEQLKLGFSYRARADLRFDDGDAKFAGAFSPTKTKLNIRPLPLPPVINAGVFWQISSDWAAEFVYEYAHWQEFNRLSAFFSPVPIFLPLGAPIAGFNLPAGWRNTSTLRLGSYYTLDKNWEVRGGIAVEQSPIPNKTLNPAIPDADKLTLNAGVGYKLARFSIDLGYMAALYKTRTVRNNELEGVPATGLPFLGAGFPSSKDKYQSLINFVSVSFGYRFGQ